MSHMYYPTIEPTLQIADGAYLYVTKFKVGGDTYRFDVDFNDTSHQMLRCRVGTDDAVAPKRLHDFKVTDIALSPQECHVIQEYVIAMQAYIATIENSMIRRCLAKANALIWGVASNHKSVQLLARFNRRRMLSIKKKLGIERHVHVRPFKAIESASASAVRS